MSTRTVCRWLALLLSLVALGACTQEGPLRQRASGLTAAEIRTIKFELLSDWHRYSGVGTLASSTHRSEGQRSLALSGMGYIAARNLTPLTNDDQQAPEVVGYDLWIPTQQPNPGWHGDTQLSIDAPSAGVHQQYLGYRSLQNLPKGQWVHVEFPVPSWIRQALDSSNYNDLRFVIALNVAPGSSTHYLDNFTLGPVPTTCTPVSDNNACTSDTCNPVTGQSIYTPAAPGTSCSDGNACNGAEACNASGACQAGAPPTVDDGNPCTADACNASGGVTHTPVSAGTSCSDSNACNGAEACNATGTCQAGAPPAVDDGNSCTTDSCDPVSGVSHTPAANGTSCSDGNACTTVDACTSGVCVGSESVVCEASDECHVAGVCDPATGACSEPAAPDGTTCDDGLTCSAGDACEGGECVGGDTADIEEIPCQVALCDEVTGGIVYEPLEEGSACSLDSCTFGTCSASGECIVTESTVVDDGDLCTIDYCDPELGPVHKECSELDPTVATTVLSAYAFLFEDEPPVQTGVAPGTIEERRATLISGTILTRTGEPLPSVEVTVHDHPEFGQTLTHADGRYAMVVNGGGTLQVSFRRAGFLQSSRRLEPRWNQTHEIDPVVLIPSDPVVTPVALDPDGDDFLVARGSVSSDGDGVRQATVLFPPGVQATMRHADGSLVPLEEMHVRLTEFTVGDDGPAAMPASLPSMTAYTYAFEVSADEAVAAGAPEITFSEPLPFYVENFLEFPAGTVVPLGSYEREQGVWIPHDNGVVVDIVSESGTPLRANLDVTGDGVADSGAPLTAHGITDAEREQLALLYDPDVSLWRVRLPHFTDPWDANWPFGGPSGSEGPGGGGPQGGGGGMGGGGCGASGNSTIWCQTQTFAEQIDLAGLPWSLHYSSDRVIGHAASRTLTIPITDSDPPTPLKRVDLEVAVAGRRFEQSFPADPDQSYDFIWDGLDAFGRVAQGARNAEVTVRYAYDGVYEQASRFDDPAVGHFPPGVAGDRTRQEIYMSQTWTVPVGAWNARDTGLAGWDLSVHHSYDPGSGQLMLGDGTLRTAQASSTAIYRVHAETGQLGLAPAPDGSFYSCQQSGNVGRIYHVKMDGTRTLFAGNGVPSDSYSGDGGPALDAGISCYLGSLALGPDGSLYLGAQGVRAVRRIDPSGIITTVAGTNVFGHSGDEGPATDAQIGDVFALAVSPDGTLYVSENGGAGRGYIRRIGPDGIIRTLVDFFQFTSPDIEFDSRSGRLYLVTNTQPVQVATVDAGGQWELVFGCTGSGPGVGNCAGGDYSGRAIPALEIFTYEAPRIALGASGQLAVRSSVATYGGPFIGSNHVWEVGNDGLVRSHVGVGGGTTSFRDGLEFSNVALAPTDLGYSPSGLILADGASYVVRPPFPGIGVSDLMVPSEDGRELYRFDHLGRHLQTLHGLTHAVLLTFDYDSAGLLVGVTDNFELRTTIERDSSGMPTAIVAPYGQRTELEVDADGYLESVSKPGGENYSASYFPGGLMSDFSTPLGGGHMTYDAAGRIATDEDVEGAVMSLDRAELASGWLVVRESELGQEYTYEVEKFVDGSQLRTNAFPNGTGSVWARDALGGGEMTVSDGSTITTALTSEPRLGVLSPTTSSSTTVLPSSLSKVTTSSRDVEMSNPQDLSTLVSQTDVSTVDGHAFTSTYTAATRSYERETPEGRLSQEFLDEFGRTIELRSGGSPNLRTVYTDDKITAIVIDPDTTVGNGNERVTQLAYDSSGHLISLTDPLTKVTTFTDFDAADRPETIVLPDASEVQVTYDVLGNVASVTPPGQAQHTMTYGVTGRIESYAPPVGNAVSYEYDLDRHVDLIDFSLNVLGQSTAPGAEVDFVWDNPSGQLLTVTSPTGAIDVGYTLGKMTSLVAPSASGAITTSLVYDGPLPTSLGWSGPVSGEVSWTYNGRFLVETETIGALPSTEVTYAYDDDGLVTQAGELVIGRDAASGRVLTKTVGNLRETYQYTQYGELARQTVERMSGSTAIETLYDAIYEDGGASGARDALGRITKKTEAIVTSDTPISGARSLTSHEYDYGYNSNGRPWLESVAVDGEVVSAYAYDNNGNRTSAELDWSQLGYSTSFDASLDDTDTDYNTADQLLTYGTREYTWNAFGQLESVLDTATQDETAYHYDLYGNLLSVELPDGRTIEYDVDGAGRRVGRRVLDAQQVELEYRGWIYRDLLRPIAEVDGSGNVVARYVYLDGEGSRQNGMHQLATRLGANQDTSLPFAGSNVPEYIEMLDGEGDVDQTLRLIVNQVGTVQAVVDVATGEVEQRLEHDEFGRVLFDSHPGLQPFGFAGGLVDADTGLVRFGARDYEPVTGRWTARDPVKFGGGSNAYLYSTATPTQSRDASGLKPPHAYPPLHGDACRRFRTIYAGVVCAALCRSSAGCGVACGLAFDELFSANPCPPDDGGDAADDDGDQGPDGGSCEPAPPPDINCPPDAECE